MISRIVAVVGLTLAVVLAPLTIDAAPLGNQVGDAPSECLRFPAGSPGARQPWGGQALRDTLVAFPLSAHRLGPLMASYAYATDLHLNGAVHVVIIGKATDPRTAALWRGAQAAVRPGKTIAAYDPDGIDADRLPAPVAAMLRQQAGAPGPRAYVCSGTVCSLPQQDADALRELVERLARRP